MALPPLAGATNATEIEASPRVTVGAAGVPGSVAGTVDEDPAEAEPFPTAFVAKTEHVYVLPFVNDDTTIGEEPPVFEPGAPPSDDVQLAV